MTARVELLVAAMLMSVRLHAAQTPPPAGGTPAAAAPQPAAEKSAQPQQGLPNAAAPPGTPPPYTYTPDGRRDPFVSLVARGTQPAAEVKGSSNGISSLATGEISVRGVVQIRGSYVAMVQAPDAKTYIVHLNDRLADGVIKQITPQGVVVLQDVNDPLAQVKQREVRKYLRSAEEGQ